MTSWTNAPVEVLLQAFSYLESHDASQCQITCRNWSKTGQSVLYKDVKLSSIAKATSFVHAIVSSLTLPGNHVKKLDLNDIFTPHLKVWDSLGLFSKLVENCPNVEVVSLLKPFRSFWVRLMHERYEGRWKSLTSVPHPIEDTEIEYYNFAILALRDTINSILLCDQLTYSTANNVYKAEYNALERHLKEFKNLKTLKIKTHTNKCLTEFDAVIDDCPDLTDLDVTLFALEPLNADQQIDWEGIKENTKVCRLHVDAVLHSDIIFKYIYNKFKTINVLEVNTTCDKRTLLLMKRSKITIMDEGLEYLKLITKIPSYTISNLYIENLTAVLRAILDGETDGDLEMEYVNDEPATLEPSTRLNLSKDTRKTKPVKVLFSANDRAQILHHNQLLEEIGGSLKTLTINMRQLKQNNTQVFNPEYLEMMSGFHLDHIFRTCSSLNDLAIVGGQFVACNPVAGINDSIETLYLQGCSFYSPVFYQLSVRLPALKTLIVNGYGVLTSTGEKGNFNGNFVYDMPYNSFEEVWHRTSRKAEDGVIHLRICTMTGEKYFKASEDGLQSITATVYHSLTATATFWKFLIRCRSIKTFSITTDYDIYRSFAIP